jgi:hypothetical protein
VHAPDLNGVHVYWAATERYYARNQAIVDESDKIIAFVAPDRTGGTEDTIRRARRAGKPVELRRIVDAEIEAQQRTAAGLPAGPCRNR